MRPRKYKLNEKDIEAIETLVIWGFDKRAAYNSLYPDRNVTDSSKIKYFSKISKKNKEQYDEYVKKYSDSRMDVRLLNRDQLVTKIMLNIEEAKKAGKYSAVNAGYSLIGKLYGFMIQKIESTTEIKPVEIQYILPALKTDN